MPPRTPAMFLLSLLLVNAAFGGSRVLSICLGGGHEHDSCAPLVAAPGSPDAAPSCGAECSHQASLPLPVPSDDHADDCGCTDVEVELCDVPAPPRDSAIDRLADNVPDGPVALPGHIQIAAHAVRGPPSTPPGSPPGLPPCLGALRTVRLLI
ncbi:MAG: hypothetical protein AB8G96_05040 [Phycisphaerales bacterium]